MLRVAILSCLVAFALGLKYTILNPNQANKDAAAERHNYFRAQLKIDGFPTVSWVDKVAQESIDGAKTCQLVHRKGRSYGENIYWASGIISDVETALIRAVNAWASEEQFVDYPDWLCSISSFYPGMHTCGHYSQVVWKKSTEIGCGVSHCSEANGALNERNGTFVFCAYNARGNYYYTQTDPQGNPVYLARKPFDGPYHLDD